MLVEPAHPPADEMVDGAGIEGFYRLGRPRNGRILASSTRSWANAAVNEALLPLGVSLTELPMTADRILSALRAPGPAATAG